MNFAIMRFLSFLFGIGCAAEQALRAAQRGGFQDQLRLPRSVRKERRQLANLSIQWRWPIGERDAKDMTGHDMQSPPSLLLHFCYFGVSVPRIDFLSKMISRIVGFLIILQLPALSWCQCLFLPRPIRKHTHLGRIRL
jgi:hypothetical protein